MKTMGRNGSANISDEVDDIILKGIELDPHPDWHKENISPEESKEDNIFATYKPKKSLPSFFQESQLDEESIRLEKGKPNLEWLHSPIQKRPAENLTIHTEVEKDFQLFGDDKMSADRLQSATGARNEAEHYNSQLDKNISRISAAAAAAAAEHHHPSSSAPKEQRIPNLEIEIQNPMSGMLKRGALPFKNGLKYSQDQFRKIRIIAVNLALLYNLIYLPLNVSLEEAEFKGIFIAIEGVLFMMYALNFSVNFEDYRSKKKTPADAEEDLFKVKANRSDKNSYQMKEQKYNTITKTSLLVDFLSIIPFGLILELSGVEARKTNFFLIVLQFIRILSLPRISWVFHLDFFKRWYAFGNISVILFTYMIMNHIFACLFIVMANTKTDFNDTWLAKIPAPQFDYPNNVREVLDADQGTIYLHALYWSYVTSSHIGVGDVVGINSGEKYYSSFVIYVSVIMYAFLFGSLASIVEDFIPEFQRVFQKNYRYVLEYAKTSKLENFVEKIHVSRIFQGDINFYK